MKFETNGGSTVSGISVAPKEKAPRPIDPTKNGFVFAGWHTDENLTAEYDFDTAVNSNFTLYAKWTEDAASKWENPFADVRESDWFYDAVKFVAQNGIAQGMSSTSYDPHGKVTRAQFVTMLCRAYGIKERSGDNFADAGGKWHAGYLAAAKQLGISNGVGDNRFAPDEEITRAQMAAMLRNYVKRQGADVSKSADLSKYPDTSNAASWAKEAMAWAVAEGLVTGRTESALEPSGTATRAEAATLIMRFAGKILAQG